MYLQNHEMLFQSQKGKTAHKNDSEQIKVILLL